MKFHIFFGFCKIEYIISLRSCIIASKFAFCVYLMNFSKKFSFVLLLAAVLWSGIYSISNLEVIENLDATIPGKAAFKEIEPWLEKNKKIVIFSVSLDSTLFDLDTVFDLGESLVSIIESGSNDAIINLSYQSDIDPDDLINFFYDHLPLYLSIGDYRKIDSLIQPNNVRETLSINKTKLLSPEGFGVKNLLVKDPLHLLGLAMDDINQFELSEELVSGEGLYLSKDRTRLYIKGELNYNPSNSLFNNQLASALHTIQNEWNENYEENQMSYFGLFLIADANANQIKKDVILTISLAILFIVGLLIYYYRSFLVLAFFLLPGIFGVLIAISVIYFISGQISGLAFGASAIIFGIVADYSFHYFSQFKQTRDAIGTRNDIKFPLAMSSVTTIIAFLSLLFAGL